MLNWILNVSICVLVNAPNLKYPPFAKPFKLTTDASNVAIGSVLSQNNQPIGYYSITLNASEHIIVQLKNNRSECLKKYLDQT